MRKTAIPPKKIIHRMTPMRENLERIKLLENYIKKMHERHSPEQCEGIICFLEERLSARIENDRRDGIALMDT